MRYATPTLILMIAIGFFVCPGCGSDETTVIEPTETYQLTDQEAQNREQEQEALAERRQ